MIIFVAVVTALWLALPATRCIMHGLARSIRRRAVISGCSFREVECHDANLHILRCARCGTASISWRHHEPKGLR